MTWLGQLARLAERYADDLDQPVKPLTIGDRSIDTDVDPVLMGVVNLSRDSAYRESIAVSAESALRKARVQVAQGAHVVDVGAESSRPSASGVDPGEQLRALRPVVEAISAEGIPVSVECYDTEVARVGLESGATVLNLTGSGDDDVMFAQAAEHGATVILCHIRGVHARDLDGTDVQDDPFEEMLDAFGRRLERASELGVPSLAIDPGIGFGFRMHDPASRARYQATTLVSSFRLRRLGAPICHSLPHAFDVFEDQFRTAEGFFAVLGHLGGTGVYRTHEVAHVRAVLEAVSLVDSLA
ncbi:dihydropteroate synthase [Aeromicrobium sp. Leaf350]|uniref:dihydropteroate synthase n=1 Tax=Aeromicrobium sp. Leaf350 TaxID=2876565 RepID=UPI001E2C6E29|nr:dihydropteroate synthase [Aeromicrobium sp. Leaf350]